MNDIYGLLGVFGYAEILCSHEAICNIQIACIFYKIRYVLHKDFIVSLVWPNLSLVGFNEMQLYFECTNAFLDNGDKYTVV